MITGKFEQEVNLGDRNEMIQFLQNHERYDTMSSWNRLTSYSNNIKIYNLPLGEHTKDVLYEMMDCEDAYIGINALIDQFGVAHNWQYQANFNGRSSGHLVLYTGGSNESQYKSFCQNCGQKDYRTIQVKGRRCGRCGEEYSCVDYKNPPKEVYTTPAAIDMGETFEGWTDDEIAERVKLVCEFDRLCDDIVAQADELANNYQIITETVYVPQKRTSLIKKDTLPQ